MVCQETFTFSKLFTYIITSNKSLFLKEVYRKESRKKKPETGSSTIWDSILFRKKKKRPWKREPAHTDLGSNSTVTLITAHALPPPYHVLLHEVLDVPLHHVEVLFDVVEVLG